MSERLQRREFVALTASLFALIALAIDATLPAIPAMAAALAPDTPQRVALAVPAFVLGMGLGTFVTGPLSDAFGRRPVILAGVVVYAVAALICMVAPSLELLLAARVLQGLGAAGPRIAVLAMVRDLYAGRQMAQIMSFVMIVFTIVPALAPMLGAGIAAGFGWRGIFAAFALFTLIPALWFALRQRETLGPDDRRPLHWPVLWAGTREILANRRVALVIAVQAMSFAMLFAQISSMQQVFDQVYGRGASFPYWFALIAVISAGGSVLNARVVIQLGMRRVVGLTLTVQAVLSALTLAVISTSSGTFAFAVYLLWSISLFLQAALTIGNLNALGMEPLGHLAGLGASVIGALATVGAVILVAVITLMFDGTPRPLVAGVMVFALVALALLRALNLTYPAAERI